MKQISLTVTDEMREAINQIQDKRIISVSDFVRECITKEIKSNECMAHQF